MFRLRDESRRSLGDVIVNGPLTCHGNKGHRLTIYRYDSLSEDQLKWRFPRPIFIDIYRQESGNHEAFLSVSVCEEVNDVSPHHCRLWGR